MQHTDWDQFDWQIAQKAGPTDASLYLKDLVEDYETFTANYIKIVQESNQIEL